MTIRNALTEATAAEFYVCPDGSAQILLTIAEQAAVDSDPRAACSHCGQRWADHLHHDDCLDPDCQYACVPRD